MMRRRTLLTALGTGLVAIAGCTDSQSTGRQSPTATGTSRRPTATSTGDGPATGDGRSYIRPQAGLAREAYQEVVDEYSDNVEYADATGETTTEIVRNTAVQGARQGTISYNEDQTLRTDTSAEHVTAALAQLDSFNYDDGDIAAPHLVYNRGQTPAAALNYTDSSGETVDDLITANGSQTTQGNVNENWTTARADNDFQYWDDSVVASHILDSDAYQESFEDAVGPDKIANPDVVKNQFSALAYNNNDHNTDMMAVGITVGSWDAWYAAENKIDTGKAREFFDDITAVANHDGIDNFAFGYDTETDEFVALKTYTDSEYSEMNPFAELEWPLNENET